VAELNITNIPAPRVPFIDERTGLMAREWYRFFLNLFVLTGSGNNPITLEELQLGPPNQPDLTELLIQINKDIAPQYEDQSGDFLKTLDTAQLMSMMSQFANAEAAIQGAYLQPVVQTGTIANYNLDGSPTAGGVAYGTGPALAVSAAGTLGQVLTSAGAGTPTWTTPTTGTVTSVSVVSANGLAGTVATATTTPAITLSTTITGLLKGNGTAISAATSGTDYAPATSGTSILYGNAAGGFSNVTIGTGVSFAAGTLSATGSGGTVTSVSFTGGIITVGTATTTPAFTVAGTSGGIPYFSSASTWATSAALAAGSLVQGGGAGVAPSTITTGTGVVTALGVNTGTAGAFVVNGGALGTPTSGTVTNLTGTASININGTVGATTPAAGSFTTLSATGIAQLTGAFLDLNRVSADPVVYFTRTTTGAFQRNIAATSTGFTMDSGLAVTGAGTFTPSGIANGVRIGQWSDSTSYGMVSFNGVYTVAGFVGIGGDAAGGTLYYNATGGGINTHAFRISGTDKATISSTGLAVTGTLSATTGAAVGGATAGAGGLAFPATAVAVANANTLDDYEEGSWTPVVKDQNGATVTTSLIEARYIKIGKFVWVQMVLTRNDATVFVPGNVPTWNLPFTKSDTARYFPCGTWWVANNGVGTPLTGVVVRDNFAADIANGFGLTFSQWVNSAELSMSVSYSAQ